ERGAAGMPERPEIVERMADDPHMAEQLAHVVAASSFATDLVVKDPGVLLGLARDAVVDQEEVKGLIGVVGRYASRDIGPKEVGELLAGIAGRVIGHAVDAAAPEVPFAVIGLGKLGAEELN